MKQNKKKSFSEMIEDQSGMVEEYSFVFPKGSEPATFNDKEFLKKFDLFKDMSPNKVKKSDDNESS